MSLTEYSLILCNIFQIFKRFLEINNRGKSQKNISIEKEQFGCVSRQAKGRSIFQIKFEN